MKNSLIIILFFTLGILCGLTEILPTFFRENDLSSYALYLLIFLVGISVGADPASLKILKKERMRIFLVPAVVVLGTLLGTGIASFFLSGISLRESLAVGAGFGYYSISSIIIAQLAGQTLGVIALLANITREIFTLLFSPLMVKYLGKLAPIVAGGATAMDTTLPVITRFSGKEYAVIAIFSGTVLTFLVPVLVTLILKF